MEANSNDEMTSDHDRISESETQFNETKQIEVSTETSEAPSEMHAPQEQSFSFLNPDTFHLANEEQRKVLTNIYKSEFDLSHLAAEDQSLLTEALSKSGIEVQASCVVTKETTAKVSAFFRKWNISQSTKFHPPTAANPHSHLIVETEESKKNRPDSTRQFFSRGASDYPYPLSEANAVIKLVPINLSSIEEQDRTPDSVTYKAYPSELLFANLGDEDRLWTIQDGQVAFNINLLTRRLGWLKYELRRPVKVLNFVKISTFQLSYQFEDDEDLGRNVVQSVEHSMKGRLALLFRPNLKTSNSFTYASCSSAVPTDSYLFRSMNAIANL